MFALKIFDNPLIPTGFQTYHFKTCLKGFLSSVLKKNLSQIFLPIFSECLLNIHLQTFPNKDDSNKGF